MHPSVTSPPRFLRGLHWFSGASLLAILVLYPAIAVSFPTGAPASRTGAPGDIGTCNASRCHNTFALNSSTGSVTITTDDHYVPGQPMVLTVTVARDEAVRFGFEITAKDASNQHVGTFTLIDPNTEFAENDPNYVTHDNAVDGTASHAWTVGWTPPGDATTPVTFYAAGNTANGNDLPSGDHIYTTSRTVTPAPAATDYAAVLTSSQQVPANTSRATGTVTATLTGDQLTVSGSFSGLTGNVLAGHIHNGRAGTNGTVIVDLAPVADAGDPTGGTFSKTATLTAEQITALQARQLYVNIHSSVYGRGEIRGQLLPAGTTPYVALLSSGNEVPANSSAGTGTVVVEHRNDSLFVSGGFSGMEGNGLVAHIHSGVAGRNGGVIFSLTPTFDPDLHGGSFGAAQNAFALTTDQQAALEARQYYVNIHTSVHGAGELRGQVLPAVSVPLRALLTGRAQSSPNASAALGGAVVEVQDSTLVVTGGFSGLEGDLLVGHIHAGGLGIDGSVAFDLTPLADAGDSRSGTLNKTFTDVEESVLHDLIEGNHYINIHTSVYGNGEIRGQVLPFSTTVFETTFSGQNQVPVVTTGASGALIAVLEDTTLTVAGTFKDLGSAYLVSHLHIGPVDASGSVAFNLTPVLDADNLGGSYEKDVNTFQLTASQVTDLRQGEFYANIHTSLFGGGEIRGHLLASTNLAPPGPAITIPTDGSILNITGNPNTLFSVVWDELRDGNGNAVYYTWELAATPDFAVPFLVVAAGTASAFDITYSEIAALLTAAGVGLNVSTPVYHRVTATDGSVQAIGPTATATLIRGAITGTEDGLEVPVMFALHGNYPNPFNPTTTLRFDLPEAAHVSLEVVDLLGRRVLALPAQPFAAGSGQLLPVEAGTLASGVYLYRLTAQGAQQTWVGNGRFTLVK
jgi:hypothetical protein